MLELLPEQNKRLGLSSSAIWVTSLYISWFVDEEKVRRISSAVAKHIRALQSAGLDRSAMTQVEDIAKLPPFNHDMIALDTVQTVVTE